MASASKLATFAPNRVQIVISQENTGLNYVLSGFSEDSIVSIERAAQSFSLYVGADNTTTRVFNANNAANITLTLAQTSESNDVLSGLYNSDANNLDGLFSIMVKDTSGRSFFFAEEAYIGTIPTSGFANSMQTREWVISAADMEQVSGGNAKFSPAGQEAMNSLGVSMEERWT